jgi:hypothetical protein
MARSGAMCGVVSIDGARLSYFWCEDEDGVEVVM